ncbi:hypothetical protein ACLKA7_004115 [Drosophila subpalustris]
MNIYHESKINALLMQNIYHKTTLMSRGVTPIKWYSNGATGGNNKGATTTTTTATSQCSPFLNLSVVLSVVVAIDAGGIGEKSTPMATAISSNNETANGRQQCRQ